MSPAPLPPSPSGPVASPATLAGNVHPGDVHPGEARRANSRLGDPRPTDHGDVRLHRRVRIANRAFGVFVTVCAAVILYEPATAAVGNSLGLEGFWVRHAAGTGALVLAGSAFLSLYIAFCNAVEEPR